MKTKLELPTFPRSNLGTRTAVLMDHVFSGPMQDRAQICFTFEVSR